MGLAVTRCPPCDERRSADDRDHPEQGHGSNRLTEHSRSKPQQDQQPNRERRLNDDEGRVREREDLEGDAKPSKHQTDQPSRALDQADQQGGAQPLRCGSNARLERLQRQAQVEEH